MEMNHSKPLRNLAWLPLLTILFTWIVVPRPVSNPASNLLWPAGLLKWGNQPSGQIWIQYSPSPHSYGGFRKWGYPAIITHIGSMVLLYMVLHGSHQYTPSHVSINIPAPAGSVMGNRWFSLQKKPSSYSGIPRKHETTMKLYGYHCHQPTSHQPWSYVDICWPTKPCHQPHL